MTTFADALYQNGGMPVGVNPVYNKIFSVIRGANYLKGRAWFVDPSQERNGNGKSPSTPFETMEECFDNLHSGDIVYCLGNIREQLVAPVQVFDVTFVGAGNRPRNADAVPLGGGYSGVTWRAPAAGTAGQATVRVLQQGWTFINILFGMYDANSAGIEIVRNAGADDAERDGSHCSILGCRFAGDGIGIRSGVAGTFTENTFNVLVQGNKFNSCTTAILQTAGFGGNQWSIEDNEFFQNTNDITGPFSNTKILRNSMSLAPTASIVLTGGAGNMVHGNNLPGTYAAGTLYAPGTNDDWNGNAASTGFTAAVPV